MDRIRDERGLGVYVHVCACVICVMCCVSLCVWCAYVTLHVIQCVYVCGISLLSTKASRLRYLDLLPEICLLVPKPLSPQTWLCWPLGALTQCFGNICWITKYSTVLDAPQAQGCSIRRCPLPWLVWLSGYVPACEPKGLWFDSQSGHMARF